MEHTFLRLELFWALVVAAGWYGVWKLRLRLAVMVAAEPSLRLGARVLLRTVLILVTFIPLFLGVLGYLGGFSWNPAWWASSDLRNPYVLAEFFFLLGFIGVTLWWTWLADGPARLLRFQDAFADAGMNPLTLGPRGLKWFITVVCVVFLGMRLALLSVPPERFSGECPTLR